MKAPPNKITVCRSGSAVFAWASLAPPASPPAEGEWLQVVSRAFPFDWGSNGCVLWASREASNHQPDRLRPHLTQVEPFSQPELISKVAESTRLLYEAGGSQADKDKIFNDRLGEVVDDQGFPRPGAVPSLTAAAALTNPSNLTARAVLKPAPAPATHVLPCWLPSGSEADWKWQVARRTDDIYQVEVLDLRDEVIASYVVAIDDSAAAPTSTTPTWAKISKISIKEATAARRGPPPILLRIEEASVPSRLPLGYVLYVRRMGPDQEWSKWRFAHDANGKVLVAPLTKVKLEEGSAKPEYIVAYDHLVPFGAGHLASQVRAEETLIAETHEAQCWRLIHDWSYQFAVQFIEHWDPDGVVNADPPDVTTEPPHSGCTVLTTKYELELCDASICAATYQAVPTGVVPLFPALARGLFGDQEAQGDVLPLERSTKLDILPPAVTFDGFERLTSGGEEVRRLWLRKLYKELKAVFPDVRASTLQISLTLYQEGGPSGGRPIKFYRGSTIQDRPFTVATLDRELNRQDVHLACAHLTKNGGRVLVLTLCTSEWAMTDATKVVPPAERSFVQFHAKDDRDSSSPGIALEGTSVLVVTVETAIGTTRYYLELPSPWVETTPELPQWNPEKSAKAIVPWAVSGIDVWRQRWQWRGHRLPGRDPSEKDYVNERLFDGFLWSRSSLHESFNAHVLSDDKLTNTVKLRGPARPELTAEGGLLSAPGELWRFNAVAKSRYAALGGAYCPADPYGSGCVVQFEGPVADVFKPPLVRDAVPEVRDGQPTGRVVLLLGEAGISRAGDQLWVNVRGWRDRQENGNPGGPREATLRADAIVGLGTSFADTEFPVIHASAVVLDVSALAPPPGALLEVRVRRVFKSVMTPLSIDEEPGETVELLYSNPITVRLPPSVDALDGYRVFLNYDGETEVHVPPIRRIAESSARVPDGATHYRDVLVQRFPLDAVSSSTTEVEPFYAFFGLAEAADDRAPEHRVVAMSAPRAVPAGSSAATDDGVAETLRADTT